LVICRSEIRWLSQGTAIQNFVAHYEYAS